jgi:NAD(P)-dependent dehydrogenase (short-subunit alcohol dehydrogenase family)
MELNLLGQRVLITAAASGIGFAVARTLMKSGARVFISDINDEQLARCKESHSEIHTGKADVSDPIQVERLFAEVERQLGGLDVLVNNAGIAGPTGSIDEISPEAWDRTIAINLNGQFYCSRWAVPLIKAAGGGSIINMSSSAGIMGYPMRSPYAASKWAVIGLTKTMAMELGEFGIRVNAICPNAVEGPRMEKVMVAEAEKKGVTRDDIYASIVEGTSMKTWVTTDDVAGMILFLCSEAGNKISGQALSVDGHTETLR